jgi:hypothetical protein
MEETYDGHASHAPEIGIRRWGDGCFHAVEEEVPGGFIVNGILIPRDEVVQIIELATGRVIVDRREQA